MHRHQPSRTGCGGRRRPWIGTFRTGRVPSRVARPPSRPGTARLPPRCSPPLSTRDTPRARAHTQGVRHPSAPTGSHLLGRHGRYAPARSHLLRLRRRYAPVRCHLHPLRKDSAPACSHFPVLRRDSARMECHVPRQRCRDTPAECHLHALRSDIAPRRARSAIVLTICTGRRRPVRSWAWHTRPVGLKDSAARQRIGRPRSSGR